MKKIYILLLLCLVFSSATTVFAQAGDYTTSVMRWRASREGIFRNPQSSPIVFGERFKNFQGLNWFVINPNYRVIAKFVRTPNEQRFAVPTFGHSETIDIVKYGTLAFTLEGREFTLAMYQILRLRESDPNYLFVPFSDLTSGVESYGGRYIDFTIPNSDVVALDFNFAYNPDSAYDTRYICPIPPGENRLPVRVEAGEKLFDQTLRGQ